MKRHALSAALTTALFTWSGVVAAQTAAPDSDSNTDKDDSRVSNLDKITVTGFRGSIATSLETKKESNQIVESVSAEEIGKLPDISIADSIARLPGVTAQRVNGRNSTISIRGMGPDFSTTLLDGREQVSTGDNRGVEYDQYPSELINSVVVYKTQDASLIGQGLAGTVDLRSVRPLSYDDRKIVFGARAQKNSLNGLNPEADDYGNRLSASYIDQFFDHTLGVSFGVARLDAPSEVSNWNAWGYAPSTVGGRDDVAALGGSESWARSSNGKRTGVMGTLEYKPNDFYHSSVDGYYSKFKQTEYARGLLFGLAYGPSGIDGLSNAVVENNNVVSGTWSGIKPVLRNDLNLRDDELVAGGWRNEFHFNENWDLLADLSYSRADRKQTVLETYAGTADGSKDSVDFSINSATSRPDLNFGLDYGDPAIISLTDPGGWGQDGYISFPKVRDTLKSFRLVATRSFLDGALRNVEFGVNQSNRTKTRYVPSGFLALNGAADPTSHLGPTTPIPANLLEESANLGFTGIPGIITYDIDKAYQQLYTYVVNTNADVFGSQWTLDEKLTTGFVQFNIDSAVGSVPVRGNFGLQAVRADQQGRGFRGNTVPDNTDNVVDVSDGATYTDYLPSLNLTFEFPHDQLLRVAAAKQAARPRMDDMRANQQITIPVSGQSEGRWVGSGGNPRLEPWRAKALDLSYEKYFGIGGSFAIAAFYKKLDTYIYQSIQSFDFSGIDPGSRPLPESPIGDFTQPINGNGGRVRGIETQLSVPFNLISESLDGFGFVGNYSYTDSSIQPLGPGSTQPLPGLSKNVSNVTLFYEKAGFSARASQSYRSDFVGSIAGFGALPTPVYIKNSKIIDAQVGYTFQPGNALDGLGVLLQVYNLTNEPYIQYFGRPDQTQTYNLYGRGVLLGLTYSF